MTKAKKRPSSLSAGCSSRGRLRSQFKQGQLRQLGHFELACDECYVGNNSGDEDDSDEDTEDNE